MLRVKERGDGRRRDSEPRADRRSAGLPPSDERAGVPARGAAARSRRARRRGRRRAIANAALLALLGSPTIAQQAVGLPAVRPHGAHQHDQPARARAPASCASRAPTARWRCRSTATAATATSIRTAARCWRSPRRRATSPAPGARPLAATNCLNFGNPERPAIMWQFAQAVEGIGAACRALDVPITGGNVSLYNETDGKAIYPTPVIGVVGLLEHADRVVSRAVPGVGRRDRAARRRTAASSAAASISKVMHDLVRGVPPALDLDAERALQALLVDAGGRAADAVGARLLRRRPGGDARRVLLRHRRHRRGTCRSTASTCRATRTSTSRRRCSASRRRASSSRSSPERRDDGAASARRRRTCRRGSSARPAATGCGSRSAAQIVDRSCRSTKRSACGRRRSNGISLKRVA